MRKILVAAISNRFRATFTGFLVTCAVQSSSASLLTLYQSLGIIFGADIGTATTGWIVSLLGFNVKITNFALPIHLAAFHTIFNVSSTALVPPFIRHLERFIIWLMPDF